MEQTDARRLQDEYTSLVNGLAMGQGSNVLNAAVAGGDELLGTPLLPADVLAESVPGNIRKAKHFIMFLRTWLEYAKQRLAQTVVTQETPIAFMNHLQQETRLQEVRAFKFCYDRLKSLFTTLKLTDLDEYTPINTMANFATLVATYDKGFCIIFEAHDERTPLISDPRLQLCCLDASLAMKAVFDRFKTVVITSGTLSPLDTYHRMLNFTPVVSASMAMSLSANCIRPIIVTRGADQIPLTSKFDLRGDTGVTQNYGRLLCDLAAIIPDGMVCFFTSYRYMEDIVATWKDLGLLDELQRHKLIFIETKDVVETTLALDAFKRACNAGRGAVFLSVARGKVAEGIDFDRHFGRCVIMFGIPFQYTLSRKLRARLEFLNESKVMSEADFLTFDALRQTAQCMGRVIRSKTDYGLMVFADARFNRQDKLRKLPQWITQYMDKQDQSLSSDRACLVAREFVRSMAQPRNRAQEIGVTMLSQELLLLKQEQQRKAAQAMQTQQDMIATNAKAGFHPLTQHQPNNAAANQPARNSQPMQLD